MRRKQFLYSCSIQLYTAIIVCSMHGSIQAQDLKQQFTAYTQQVMQEKLYAHTDKNYYLAGEICWLKLYNVDAFFNKPLGISKLAYVELLDKDNKAVLQAKLSLKDGNGNGSLQLPVSLASGKYLLRAYTRWMKNFSPAYFFEKPITVINSRRIYTGDSVQQKSKYDIQLFPEGGNLVNGIQSRIAFRVADQSGKGVACAGFIVDEHADTVGSCTSLKFGMGSFLFTPQQSHSYKFVTLLPDNSRAVQPLPAAYDNGYVMQLTKKEKVGLQITVRAAGVNAAAGAVWLFAHTRGSVKVLQGSELKNGYTEFFIDTALLGEGISHLTVFNASRQPVCERLYFKRPAKGLQIDAVTDLQLYETRKKVTMHIGAAGPAGQPLPADMSMAVYWVDSMAGLDDMDISSYLWLNSDLVGAVESPAYYFTDPSAETEQATDNLMLTQGWRRFRWEYILQNKKPSFEFSPEFKGHIVRAKVVNNADGQPVKDAETYLSVVSSRSQVRSAYSDDSGYVKFEMNHFYGNGEVIVQTMKRENSNWHVEMVNPFADKYSSTVLPSFSLPEKNAQAVFNQHVSVQVQNTYAGTKLKQLVLPAIDTSAFYSKPDKIYMLDDYVRFTTVEEILREYVPEVNVRKRENKFYLPVFDNARRDFFITDPLILLDGVPVLDPDKIMSYDPLKIRKLEVVARMYYYGSMFFGGIINFITYNGDLPGYELDPRATVIDYETLQLQREFFSPVYETHEQALGRLPDFRSLLYWSPSVSTNNSGKQEASFYTSDLTGNFAAVLQGITADGKTGSKTIFFQVKESNLFAGKK